MYIQRLISTNFHNYNKNNRQFNKQSNSIKSNIKDNYADTVSFGTKYFKYDSFDPYYYNLPLEKINEIVPVIENASDVKIKCPPKINVPTTDEMLDSITIYDYKQFGGTMPAASPYGGIRTVYTKRNGAISKVTDCVFHSPHMEKMLGSDWEDKNTEELTRTTFFDGDGNISDFWIETDKNRYWYDNDGKLFRIDEYEYCKELPCVQNYKKSIFVTSGTKEINEIRHYPPKTTCIEYDIRRDYYEDGKVCKCDFMNPTRELGRLFPRCSVSYNDGKIEYTCV